MGTTTGKTAAVLPAVSVSMLWRMMTWVVFVLVAASEAVVCCWTMAAMTATWLAVSLRREGLSLVSAVCVCVCMYGVGGGEHSNGGLELGV
jgi:hypothetical protein